MKKILFVLGLLIGTPPSLFSQVENFRTGIDLNFLNYRDGLLYWKADCAQGFARSRLMQTPASGGFDISIYYPGGCDPDQQIRSEVAKDSLGNYFWVDAAGDVRRSSGGIPSTVSTTPEPARIAPNAQVGVSDNFVFWTERHGFELTLQSKVFYADKFGGDAANVINLTTLGGNQLITEMIVHRDDLITVLTNGKDLFQLERRYISIGDFYTWVRLDITSGDATALTVRSDRLFWVTESSDQRSALFWSAPIDDPDNDELHHIAFDTNGHSVEHFVATQDHLFYQDLQGGDGAIMRKAFDGGDAVEVAGPPGFVIRHWGADDRHVYWRHGDHTIKRIPIGAAAIERDLGATGLEVVQAIQNPENENPLIMGKPTYVRVFGQILTSTDGATVLDIWPAVELRGSKDGNPLPGSPLRPILSSPLETSLSFRTTLDDGYLFQLPDEWTRQGEILLEAEINPGRVVNETSFANNTRSFNANFLRKNPITMVMKPCRTQAGTIEGYQPGFQAWIDYVEVMLPTSDLKIFWTGGLLEEKRGLVRGWGPYEVSDSNDDGGRILRKLRRKKIFNNKVYSREGFEHYCSILAWPHPDPPGWSGYALVGNSRKNRPSTIFFNILRRDSLGMPFSVGTICQELGHNYARRHVDCGNPDNVDNDYPYDPCLLSSPEAGYIGFDPLDRRLILPDEAKDFMSYGAPNWVSDYTWKELTGRLGDLPPPSAPAPAPALNEKESGSAHLVMGFYNPETGTAELDYAFEVSGEECLRTQDIVDGNDPHPDFELRAYEASGSQLTNFPVILDEIPADAGATQEQVLTALARLPNDTTTLAFAHKGGSDLVKIEGGGAAPVVQLTAPSGGTLFKSDDPMVFEWNSSDPEGRPLAHIVRYSNDQGTSWHTLVDDYPSNRLEIASNGLPGGASSCLVEVIASDGIQTGSDTSEFFTLESKAPKPYIFFENFKGKDSKWIAQSFAPVGTPVIVHGEAYDDEDGPLDGQQLHWDIQGPVNLSGSGGQLTLNQLVPGDYQITLTAVDSHQQTGQASAQLTVDPKYIDSIGGQIVVDGFNDDPAYLSDPFPQYIRYNTGQMADIRMVEQNGNLYIAIASLPIGNNSGQFVAVSFDRDLNGGDVPQSDDIRFQIYADGRIRTFQGVQSQWVPDNQPQGLQAQVSRNAGTWNAELCIDTERLGGWNGQPVGMTVGHYHRNFSGDDTFWPGSAIWNEPDTWAATVLGPNPMSPIDSDRDGIPDQWERDKLGTIQTNGELDQDKDGQTDMQEWEAGTDPNSAQSQFEIISVEENQSSVTVSWMGQPGRSYVVLRSDGVYGFQSVDLVTSSTVQPIHWTDPDPLDTEAYYQVVAQYSR